MTASGRVVVGVDDSEVALDALRFAAREAQLRDVGLLVVHASGPATDDAASDPAPVASMLAVASAVAPDVRTEFQAVTGDAAAVLADLSQDAAVVVVGTHRTGRLRGFVLGSVSQHVAAHARGPVVTVGHAAQAPNGPVIVGAAHTGGGLAALRFAATEARRRGVPLRVVRAVTAESWAAGGHGYGLTGGMNGLDILESAARVELEHVLRIARQEFPDVAVSGAISSAYPFSALEAASRDASLMVVGTRRDEDAALPHLGPVAAWLLHQSQCPLAVVPFLAHVDDGLLARS
ncbi:MAG: universal stress protein [Jatrophihabitans sp.]|uniref:universal stress protein n=1 Tax=Jatrophihabitans sp. TaxID=1932789 RepID=UPI003F80FAB3